MQSKSLSEWLAWQETLNPAEIDLGLARVHDVAARLPLNLPHGSMFVVAGTNGKGSCATLLSKLLQAAGRKAGLYTSPHLVRYNERIAVAGDAASDAELVAAFEAIEAVRAGVPLTFFEFGTLAALYIFAARGCDACVLEVGLGGRLDAVNIVDADFSIITTVDIDHQQWLGTTVEQIAAEKAGIIKTAKPAFYGDVPVPAAIRDKAAGAGATLYCLGEDYSYVRQSAGWDWTGGNMELRGLLLPPGKGEEQLRNISLGLAVIERYDATLLADRKAVGAIVAGLQLPGRFQVLRNTHEWILDVAHNPQSARALRNRLMELQRPEPRALSVVIGMLADKQAGLFVEPLAELGTRWITCPTEGGRGASGAGLVEQIADFVTGDVIAETSVTAALERARQETPAGGRILVCGSFTVVGPALQWLGLY